MGFQSTLPHQSSHATGGSDPLTPGSLGAASLSQANTFVAAQTFQNTLTAPNASSTAWNQVANVGTLDRRYLGATEHMLQNMNNGGPGFAAANQWVELAEFRGWATRTLCEFWHTSQGYHLGGVQRWQSFGLLITLDPYSNYANRGHDLPICTCAASGQPVFQKLRLRKKGAFPGAICIDGLVVDDSSVNYEFMSGGRLLTRSDYTPGASGIGVVATGILSPDTTGHYLGQEFIPRHGALEKNTTGDFLVTFGDSAAAGLRVINTVDNNIKIWADGGWRQIASW